MIHNERGSALLTALLVFAIVLTLGGVLLTRGNYSINETARDIQQERARYLSQSALNAMVGKLQKDPSARKHIDDQIKSVDGSSIGGTLTKVETEIGERDGGKYQVIITREPDNDHLLVKAIGIIPKQDGGEQARYETQASLKIIRSGLLFNNGAGFACRRPNIGSKHKVIVDGDLVVRSDNLGEPNSTLTNMQVTGKLYIYPSEVNLNVTNVVATDIEVDSNDKCKGNVGLENVKADTLKMRVNSDNTSQETIIGAGVDIPEMEFELYKHTTFIKTSLFDNLRVYLHDSTIDTQQQGIVRFSDESGEKGKIDNNVEIYGPYKRAYIYNCPDTIFHASEEFFEENRTRDTEENNMNPSTVKTVVNDNMSIPRSLTLNCPPVDKMEEYIGSNIKIDRGKLESEFTPFKFSYINDKYYKMAYLEYWKDFDPIEGGKPRRLHVVVSNPENHTYYTITSKAETESTQQLYNIIERVQEDTSMEHYFVIDGNVLYDATGEISENDTLEINIPYSATDEWGEDCYIYIHSPNSAVNIVSLPRELKGALLISNQNHPDFTPVGDVTIKYVPIREIISTITPTTGQNLQVKLEEYK